MRALKIAALMSVAVIGLCSCGEKVSADDSGNTEAVSTTAPFGGITPKEEAFATDGEYDVDLTQLNSSMVYAQVYDMINQPDSYKGKTVKAKGNFAYFKDGVTEKEYFAVLISDATACCSQGIEFVLDGEHTYPNDYPAIDSEITVTGKFDYYKEDGNTYVQLTDAKLEEGKLSW